MWYRNEERWINFEMKRAGLLATQSVSWQTEALVKKNGGVFFRKSPKKKSRQEKVWSSLSIFFVGDPNKDGTVFKHLKKLKSYILYIIHAFNGWYGFTLDLLTLTTTQISFCLPCFNIDGRGIMVSGRNLLLPFFFFNNGEIVCFKKQKKIEMISNFRYH